DVVETGTTLRQAGLEPFGESIMTSQAVLFSRPGLELEEEPAHALEVLERRIRGVLVAREYVMLDYDIPSALLERAVQITPGLQSPTVSPLHGGEWSAVRAMVDSRSAHRMMDELYDAGARAILVTAIQACRICDVDEHLRSGRRRRSAAGDDRAATAGGAGGRLLQRGGRDGGHDRRGRADHQLPLGRPARPDPGGGAGVPLLPPR